MPRSEKIADVKPFVISRVFAAPSDLLWKVWTQAAHLHHWWGPKGTAATTVSFSFRPGGINHYYMTTPDGTKLWGKQVYREITAPKHIVFVNSFSDAHGTITRHPLSPHWPLEMLTTVAIKAQGPATEVTVTWLPINANAEEVHTFDAGRDSMMTGWSGSFDQLAEYLATL